MMFLKICTLRCGVPQKLRSMLTCLAECLVRQDITLRCHELWSFLAVQLSIVSRQLLQNCFSFHGVSVKQSFNLPRYLRQSYVLLNNLTSEEALPFTVLTTRLRLKLRLRAKFLATKNKPLPNPFVLKLRSFWTLLCRSTSCTTWQWVQLKTFRKLCPAATKTYNGHVARAII